MANKTSDINSGCCNINTESSLKELEVCQGAAPCGETSSPTMLRFVDFGVPYGVFVADVASAVVAMMKEPEYISQREAFRRFGRANVERWRRNLLIEPCKRPGKLEYKTADLRRLQAVRQDYFTR